MAVRHKFRDCKVGSTNVVDDWIRQQPDDVRVEFRVLFKYLGIVEIVDWRHPKAIRLKGKALKGLWEFRVKAEKIHYRLPGFVGPGEGQVTLFAGWTHSQNKAAQKSAMLRAANLKMQVENGEVTTVDHVN